MKLYLFHDPVIRKRCSRKKVFFLPALFPALLLCAVIAASLPAEAAAFCSGPPESHRDGSCIYTALSTGASAAQGGSSTDSPQADAEDEEGPEDGTPFIRNRWNYVDASMDISNGIPEDAEGRLGRIREVGKLRVATEPYYAPQEFIDPSLSGQASYLGSDIELARLIAERMGVELEIVPLEFTKVISKTAEGAYDLAISGLAYTPGRANMLELSKGYHYTTDESSTGFLIRKSDKDVIKGVEDLAEKDIAAQIGSLQEMLAVENVREYRQFIRFSSMNRIYDALEKGEVDAAAVDIETARHHIQNNPSCGLILLEGVGFQLEEPFQGDRVAAPGGEIQLICFVNGVIDEVLENGQYEKWFQQYLNYARGLGL